MASTESLWFRGDTVKEIPFFRTFSAVHLFPELPIADVNNRRLAAKVDSKKHHDPRRRGVLIDETPRAGFEPATNRLTVDRSTAELPRNVTKRTYPSALPSRKRLKLSSQGWTLLP